MRKPNESGMFTDGYIAYTDQLLNGQNPSEVPRKVARASYNNFMANKDEQIARLQQLLELNGLRLSDNSGDIRAINEWLVQNICTCDDYYIVDDGERQNYIHPDWSNVVFDLSIFASEVIISKTKNVSWAFKLGTPREVSFQYPVLMGFSKIQSKQYYVNMGLSLFNYARDVIDGLDLNSSDQINYFIESAIQNDVDLETTMFDHSDFLSEIG
jgi:hypothetical protein